MSVVQGISWNSEVSWIHSLGLAGFGPPWLVSVPFRWGGRQGNKSLYLNKGPSILILCSLACQMCKSWISCTMHPWVFGGHLLDRSTSSPSLPRWPTSHFLGLLVCQASCDVLQTIAAEVFLPLSPGGWYLRKSNNFLSAWSVGTLTSSVLPKLYKCPSQRSSLWSVRPKQGVCPSIDG